MKPIKQMKLELGLKAIRAENDELASRRSKKIAEEAAALEAKLQLAPGTPSSRGPFYTNRSMRRAGYNPLSPVTRSPQYAEGEGEQVKTFKVGDMLRAVRGLRRKTG